MTTTVRVWDLPTRVFHWALALCFAGLLATGYSGGAWMDWHFRLGYTMLGLLLFRLVWGLVGGHWSRFASFAYGFAATKRYFGSPPQARLYVGHSPLGAISVFAMLLMLVLQVSSGLLSDDEIAFAGPLTQFVSSAWVRRATFYHKDIGQLVLVALAVLHIVAIGFYLFKKRDNLLKPMLTGDKPWPEPVVGSRDDARSRIGAALLALAVALLIWFLRGLVA
jgi:cytochrome b